MKAILFIIMVILLPIVVLSQNLEKIGSKGEAQRNNKNEIGFFKATADIEAITNKNDFFRSVLNIADTDMYKFEKKGDSEKERRFEMYHQYYRGVPVKDGVYVLHWRNGKLENANGNYIRIDKLNPNPTLTEKEALDIWSNYQKIPANEISRLNNELFVVDLNRAEETKTESKVVLAYRIRLYSTNIKNSLIGYIDAHTGEVCLTEPIALTCAFPITNADQNFNPMPFATTLPPPATGTFVTRYNGVQNATTESRNSLFFLEDWTRTNGIVTWNRNNLNAADTTGVKPFADNDNNWSSAEWANAANDNAALDVNWTLQKIYDYYLNVHGRRGWDSLGQSINAYVHALIPIDQSGNTSKDNAAYFDGEYLAFGDGESKFKPLASLDVVAHEYAHGINDHTSGFNGSGIIRSFNEGLSDIWAATIESYVAPQKNRWKIGEEVMLTKSCLRNLLNPSDPNADWQIAHTFGTSDYNNNSEAYYRSGIMSHWFYLLSDGGSGTNGLGNSYTVHGLGIEAAAILVYFAQARRYLNGTTTYPLMRTNMISAANALFGDNSFQSLQVANAWYAVAVGVGDNPGQVTISGSQTVCYPSASTFIANSAPSGSAISWTTGNGTLSIVSGGNTATPTISAASSSSRDTGWIQVNFTSNGVTTAGPKIIVRVNGPYYSDISFDVYRSNGTQATKIGDTWIMCPNTTYQIYVMNSGPVTLSNYTWIIPSAWNRNYTSQNIISIYTNSSPGGPITVNATTGCNNTTQIITGYMGSSYSCSGYSLFFSPNPSTSVTMVSIASDSEEAVTNSAEWDLEVYDSMQNLKAKVQKLKGNTKTINTSGWRIGIYIVRVKIGDEIITGKLSVKQ